MSADDTTRNIDRNRKIKSNLDAVRKMTDEELERLIADDPDEADIEWDWDNAVMVYPGERDLTKHIANYRKKYGDDYRQHLDKALEIYIQTH